MPHRRDDDEPTQGLWPEPDNEPATWKPGHLEELAARVQANAIPRELALTIVGQPDRPQGIVARIQVLGEQLQRDIYNMYATKPRSSDATMAVRLHRLATDRHTALHTCALDDEIAAGLLIHAALLAGDAERAAGVMALSARVPLSTLIDHFRRQQCDSAPDCIIYPN